tara:strand:+ start:1492 stop:1878 length:387 start_codon:yes stop_codon:yes gene_type:complete
MITHAYDKKSEHFVAHRDYEQAQAEVFAFERFIEKEENIIEIGDTDSAVTCYHGQCYLLEPIMGYDCFEGEYTPAICSTDFYNMVKREYFLEHPQKIVPSLEIKQDARKTWKNDVFAFHYGTVIDADH